jgi:tetratricopeptide (TPR) repeat protein
MRHLIPLFLVIALLWVDPAWTQRDEMSQGRLLEEEDRVDDALQLYHALYQKYPQDARIFSALKRAYFKLERYDEFATLMEQAYEESRTSEYAFALGEVNMKMGKTEDSRRWFVRFLEEDSSETSFHKVASVYISADMLEEAVKTYEEGRRYLENDSLFAREMALLYSETDLDRALKEALRLHFTVPDERVWVKRMLKQQVKKGNRNAVLGAIEDEMNSRTEAKELHTLLGDVLVELDDYEKALEQYRLSEESKALLRLAKECEEEGKLTLALQAYEDYLRKNPNSIEAYVGMGDCYSAMNDHERAEEFYEKILGRAEGDEAVKVQYKLGSIKALRGDFPGARTHYAQIERDFPSAASEAVFNTIDSYLQEGQLERAEEKCQDALRYDESRTCYLLGEIHYYRGDFTEAVEFYKKVIDRNPNSLWVNDSMERLLLLSTPDEQLKKYAQAEALLLERKHDESIELSKTLLRDAPSSEISPHALFLIARAYEDMGRPAVAIEGYRDMIDNYPESHLCAHAQYRIGFLYLYELKDIETGKEELETVLFQYPENVIAEKVRNELRSLP